MYEDLIIRRDTNKVSQFVWVQAKGMIVLQAFEIEERNINTTIEDCPPCVSGVAFEVAMASD